MVVVLLALGAAAVSSLLTGGFIRSDLNSAQSRAVDLATQEIEDMRSLDYTTLASRTAPNSPDVSGPKGVSYTIQSTVTRDAPAPNMSTIVVLVSWQQRGQNYGYQLQSIYADTRR